MKPIAVVLTDTHKNKENLELVEHIFRQAVVLASEIGCKRIFHAGDWFTNRIGQNLSTLLSMKRVLEHADDNGVMIHGIPGNHDKTDQDSESSYLDVFSQFGVLQLFSSQGYEVFGDVCVGFLPYFTSSYIDRLEELEAKVSKQKAKKNILITHKSFNGVRNNDGSLVEDGVAPSRMKFWDKVLVGHYHDASEVGDNIFYIGSAYQANYGENITDKGFSILYSDGSIKFVQSEFPKYKKIKIDAADVSAIENELEVHSNSKDHVRFVFVGKKTDLDKIVLSRFTDVGIDCKFESDDSLNSIIDVDGDNFTQFDMKTIVKHFLHYCKLNEIPADKRSLGLKILKDDYSEI
jgi:exonuclease SbcD